MAIQQTTEVAAAPPAGSSPAGAAAPPAPSGGGSFFRTLLSDLNPLQYVPGVGAIYRMITGDEGDPTLRFVASLGTSFALGGPVGVGITVAEKVTGFDPERIARHLLSGLFQPAATPPAAPAAATAGVGAGFGAGAGAAAPAAARPWTADELAAYGVRSRRDHELAAGGIGSADVLNTLELHRLSSTYA